MKPPDNAKGGSLSETAPRKALARELDDLGSVKVGDLEPIGEAVNDVSIVHGDLCLWLREAFNLLNLCRTEPEKGLRYLALWFVRLGRAMA